MALNEEKGIDMGKLSNKISTVMLDKCVTSIPAEAIDDIQVNAGDLTPQDMEKFA
jgi:hypothetical protein